MGDVSAFPATEQAVWAYNTGQPRARLRAFPLPGAPAADFPLVTPPEGGNRQAALAKLIAFLRGPSALPVLEANGLRSGDGSPAGFVTPGNGLLAGRGPARPLTVDAGTVDAALAAWTQLSRPVNVLAMVDASGSMAATHGFDQPMIDVVAEALDDGLDLLPPGSASGLAVFSAASDRSPLLRDLVPLESQSARLAGLDHTQAIRQALEQVRPAGGTPLCDAVLRAYQTVQHAYRPGMINVVLLLSDGIAEDARTPLTLPALLSTLHREADPKRPVRIVTIACHDEGQTGDLQKIATATSGRSLAVYVPRSAATGGVGPAQGPAGKWVEPPDITSLIAEAVVGL